MQSEELILIFIINLFYLFFFTSTDPFLIIKTLSEGYPNL
jgi:hypothetical protein